MRSRGLCIGPEGRFLAGLCLACAALWRPHAQGDDAPAPQPQEERPPSREAEEEARARPPPPQQGRPQDLPVVHEGVDPRTSETAAAIAVCRSRAFPKFED